MLSEEVLAQAIIKNVSSVYATLEEQGARFDNKQLEAIGRGVATAVIQHLRTNFQASGVSSIGPTQITGCY